MKEQQVAKEAEVARVEEWLKDMEDKDKVEDKEWVEEAAKDKAVAKHRDKVEVVLVAKAVKAEEEAAMPKVEIRVEVKASVDSEQVKASQN